MSQQQGIINQDHCLRFTDQNPLVRAQSINPYPGEPCCLYNCPLASKRIFVIQEQINASWKDVIGLLGSIKTNYCIDLIWENNTDYCQSFTSLKGQELGNTCPGLLGSLLAYNSFTPAKPGFLNSAGFLEDNGYGNKNCLIYLISHMLYSHSSLFSRFILY